MAIGIVFKKGQGLGNQLWNYAAGVGIAKMLGVNFCIHNYPAFKAKDFLEINMGGSSEKYNFNAYFNEKIYNDIELKYKSSGFDEEILNIKDNVILNGLFQDERYILPIKNELSKYINFNPREIDIENSCILNIRGGEYKKHLNFMLKKSYWDKSIKYIKDNYGINNFMIVTDDYKYSKILFPGYEVISESIFDCYNHIYQSSYIILSNSTFSYFPVETGKKKKIIIAPAYWARPYNNKNRWCSVANYYSNWKYMLPSGEFIDNIEIKEIIKSTEQFYFRNNCIEKFQQNSNNNFLLNEVKIFIKLVLNIFLPRYF